MENNKFAEMLEELDDTGKMFLFIIAASLFDNSIIEDIQSNITTSPTD